MNVSPLWMEALANSGFEVHHWSNIGRADAPDEEILRYATAQHMTIFTQDLDFGIALARTGAELPSVVQLRSSDVLPAIIGERVISALHQVEQEFSDGVLITIDPKRTRVKVLPIRSYLRG